MTLPSHAFRFVVARARILLILLAAALLPRVGLAQNVNDGVDPNAINSVLALAAQADGKIIVRGAFTTIDGQARSRLARLNAWNAGY